MAGAIISGIAALIGAGVSAGGVGAARREEREAKEERERLSKLGEERFQQELGQQKRQTGLGTIGLLSDRISRARQGATRLDFARDLRRAVSGNFKRRTDSGMASTTPQAPQPNIGTPQLPPPPMARGGI